VYTGGTGTLNIVNTIVAGNTATASGPDAYGIIASQGDNLVDKTDGSSAWVGSDLTGTVASPLNPLLTALGDYGGPTQTMALQSGSPAINAGTATGAPATDQRGFARRRRRYRRLREPGDRLRGKHHRRRRRLVVRPAQPPSGGQPHQCADHGRHDHLRPHRVRHATDHHPDRRRARADRRGGDHDQRPGGGPLDRRE
jgi:hypothetical protein